MLVVLVAVMVVVLVVVIVLGVDIPRAIYNRFFAGSVLHTVDTYVVVVGGVGGVVAVVAVVGVVVVVVVRLCVILCSPMCFCVVVCPRA